MTPEQITALKVRLGGVATSELEVLVQDALYETDDHTATALQNCICHPQAIGLVQEDLRDFVEMVYNPSKLGNLANRVQTPISYIDMRLYVVHLINAGFKEQGCSIRLPENPFNTNAFYTSNNANILAFHLAEEAPITAAEAAAILGDNGDFIQPGHAPVFHAVPRGPIVRAPAPTPAGFDAAELEAALAASRLENIPAHRAPAPTPAGFDAAELEAALAASIDLATEEAQLKAVLAVSMVEHVVAAPVPSYTDAELGFYVGQISDRDHLRVEEDEDDLYVGPARPVETALTDAQQTFLYHLIDTGRVDLGRIHDRHYLLELVGAVVGAVVGDAD